jgi:hypothetical protein
MTTGKQAIRRAGLVSTGAVALTLGGGTLFAGTMFGGVAVAATGGVLPSPSSTPCPSPISSVCSTLHKTDKDVKKTVHHLLSPGSSGSGGKHSTDPKTTRKHHHHHSTKPGGSKQHASGGGPGARQHGRGTPAGRAAGQHKGYVQGVGFSAGVGSLASYAALPALPQGFSFRAIPTGQAPLVAAAPGGTAGTTTGASAAGLLHHSSAAGLPLLGGHRDTGLPIAAVAVAIATIAGVALAHAGVLQQRLGRGGVTA